MLKRETIRFGAKWLLSVHVIVMCLSVDVECKRFGGGRISIASKPSSYHVSSSYHPSSSFHHPSPSSLSYSNVHLTSSRLSPSHNSGSSSTVIRPIGFENFKPIGSARGVGSSNYGFNTGNAAHRSGNPPGIGFKPSVIENHSVGSGGRTRISSRPSYHPSPSYRPAPSSHPNPTSLSYPSWHPAPNSRPSPNVGSPSPAGPPIHNSPNSGSGSGSSHDSRPPDIGFKPSVTHGHPGSSPPAAGTKPSAPPAEHATNLKPLGDANTGSRSPPPYGWNSNPAPVGPPTNVNHNNVPPGAPYPVHPPAYTPHNPGIPPPAYNPAHNPAGYGPPPAYSPTHNPTGYGHPPAYPQQQNYPGGYSYPNQHSGTPGITNVNINNINTNNHHYAGGGYGGGGYGGFGYSAPSYHYQSSDVGSGTLGFFLGYSLAKVTTPTFHSHSGFYDGYTPRYDHYEIHHYYHNKDSIPAQSTIQPNTIVGCVGDSSTICPSGTTSLCTNNGAILCVASATSTVPCTDQKQGNCIRTIIPCVNGTKDCEVGQNKTLTIPCISKAQVPGNITYINNTIIVNNTTIINNNGGNSTAGNGTIISSNSTTLSSANAIQNGTVSLTNLTDSALSSLSNITETTTTIPPVTLLPNVTSDGARSKRETPAVPVNEFCVTILALPAERKLTEQEQVFQKGTTIFSKFLVKALGIH